MQRERLESLIIDYIDNALGAADRQTIEQEMLINEDARRLYQELVEIIQVIDRSVPLEPSSSQQKTFEDMLRREMKRSNSGTNFRFTPAFYRVAAAIALLIVGVSLGFWISKYNAQQETIAGLRKEMESARRQMEDTKHLMLGMLGNEHSASQRIKGVNVALALTDADDEIVGALFKTLQEDPNTNVRLAALDALSRFQNDHKVRRHLIRSLQTQKDPMVQIRLIQLMVQMKERGVVDQLQDIVDDARTIKAVRDEAYTGILKLS